MPQSYSVQVQGRTPELSTCIVPFEFRQGFLWSTHIRLKGTLLLLSMA